MREKDNLDQEYWEQRYRQNRTEWDVGSITPPLKSYIDQLSEKSLQILLPGGGNGYEAEYLHQKGFSQVFLLDFAQAPLLNFRERVPSFPEGHLLQQDFFTLTPGLYDLVLEQTFFCALPREFRTHYARQVFDILKPGGKLVGVLFSEEFEKEGPPFGGTALEYQAYFEPYFRFIRFEPCQNSVKPRQGRELFIELQRRDRPQFIA
ncbi:methyltransferase domain-containing protein [Rufibacter latericius]|uniref:Methyltransferase domain-containing protein n=1 Tax=Rufibacter latericius TaxID=2487040 RepID=A0A3M9MA25_9BACT|nr:methyltransferase domain-containing protein [Rufibacter latericius]RNI22420.1 methyltransferase domain-containing protein [Rufibacter latericius]